MIDCDASEKWCAGSRVLCPCLTKSRRHGSWHIGQGRRVPGITCLRLQGLSAEDVGGSFDEKDLRAFAGNAMSLCIIEPLMRNALIAVDSRFNALDDRWGTGVAQARLVLDAWGGRPPTDIIDRLPPSVASMVARGSDCEHPCADELKAITNML